MPSSRSHTEHEGESDAIGLGCMRLSTAHDRDEERAITVIRAALDAGATLLDTADAYCHDERDSGHNERLIARALASWPGDHSRITVATKGGMRRPKGAWVPDGRAKHLQEACDASRAALGVEVIDLYQLHAVDPKTSPDTSVRALARLQEAGKVREIGLCNVTVDQIRAARAIAAIAAVQASLSPLDDENLRNGVAEYCRGEGIRLIAHRPLGGTRVRQLAKSTVLSKIAHRHDVTVEEVALAWLIGLGVTPVPGATRVATAQSIARALALELDATDRDELDAALSGRLLRIPRAHRRPHTPGAGDVVVIMGMPGAGKSTLARELERDGYERLNRDALGGALTDLVPRLDALLASGRHRVVLDNTYPTRASRNEVIEAAWHRGALVRCLWLTTSVGDAQINSIQRMLEVHGSLPTPEEIKARAKKDPRYLLPDAQFRYERTLEPPSLEEGFESVEEREFDRAPTVGAPALILDYDDAVAGRDVPEGWPVFVHAWRPGGTAHDVATLRASLPPEYDFACCTHPAGPPACWCRKPIPGAVLEFAKRRGVSLERSVVVGRSQADRTMAERIGAQLRS